MHHGILALPPLCHNEQNYEYYETHERANHIRAIPSFGDAAPLHGKDEADDSTDDEREADNVQLAKHAAPVRSSFGRFVGEEEKNEKTRYTAYGEVDVEAMALLALEPEAVNRKDATCHHRQETWLVKAPPINGPTTLAKPYAAPIKPLYFGRSAGETRTAIIVYEPAKRPAAPMPHIARPMMRATELGAAPDAK